jgi:4-hydroxybenzoate polyprenyltransferase
MSAMRLFDRVFLLRPLLHVPTWTVFLLGDAFVHGGSFRFVPTPWPVARALLLFTATVGGIYVVNQIADIESDRRNNKLHILPRGLISACEAWVYVALLFAAGLIGAFWILSQLGVAFALATAFGLVYSLPPARLKDRAISGLVANGIGHGALAFVIGAIVSTRLDARMLAAGAPYVFAVAAVYLFTAIVDVNGDRAESKRTAAVAWGVRSAGWVAVGCHAVALCAAVFAGKLLFGAKVPGDPVLAAAAAISFPFMLAAAIRGGMRDARAAVHVMSLSLAVGVGVQRPWFFVLILCCVLASRLYYRRRFGMSYPTYR